MTYSDLVTLLLVFFVLLYILTPGVDDSVFDNFISYFQSSVGVVNQSAVVGQQDSNYSDFRIQIVEQWEMVEDFLEQLGLLHQVDIEATDDGIKITLSDSLTFESGSDDLLPGARTVLREVATLFDENVREVEAQGHTDNVPIAQDTFFRSNWHLGSARAISVIQFLQDESQMDEDRFRAVSHGEYRPVADNDTPEGRRQNRRVEIYVRYHQLPLPGEVLDELSGEYDDERNSELEEDV